MTLTETRDNNYTVALNGVNLHSKYSPLKEAKKFIAENLTGTGTIITLGGGLGYILTAIKDEYPEAEIISIPYSTELLPHSKRLNPTPIQWNRDIKLEEFLRDHVTETNIKGLQLLEWPPSAQSLPNESEKINLAIVKHIRRINGNLLTTARFGRKWLINSIKNYIETDTYVENLTIERPIVIAASGKSLSQSIDTIKKIRDRITLISLSSANMALNYHGITPDITFSTDPGYYSKLHLKNYKGILSMPLSNSTSEGNPVLLINQGNSFEKEIIEKKGLPHIKLGENGTVAGTALTFALNYKEQVYLAGQDLQSSDLQTHISPYTFDNLLESQSDREEPYYSLKFKRWINQGITYNTYRDWFSYIGKQNPGRIFRLVSNSKEIPGITDISSEQFIARLPETVKPPLSFTICRNENRKERQLTALKIITGWLKQVESEDLVENSLLYLISTSNFTDGNNKALPVSQAEKYQWQCREESIMFIKRLLSLYGRKLL